MALMGGIDAAIVDRADSTEDEIRAETRRVLKHIARTATSYHVSLMAAPERSILRATNLSMMKLIDTMLNISVCKSMLSKKACGGEFYG